MSEYMRVRREWLTRRMNDAEAVYNDNVFLRRTIREMEAEMEAEKPIRLSELADRKSLFNEECRKRANLYVARINREVQSAYDRGKTDCRPNLSGANLRDLLPYWKELFPEFGLRIGSYASQFDAEEDYLEISWHAPK